jgi:hypothetical protein
MDEMLADWSFTIRSEPIGEVNSGWNVTLGSTGKLTFTHNPGWIDYDYDGWYAQQQNPNQNEMYITSLIPNAQLDGNGDGWSVLDADDFSIVVGTNEVAGMGVGITASILEPDYNAPGYAYELRRNGSGGAMGVVYTNGAVVTNGAAAGSGMGTDFGSVVAGSSVSRMFSMTNGGTTNLVISYGGVTGDGVFAVSGMPSVVDAGAVSNFWIGFTSVTAGTYSAQVVITNNSSNTVFSFALAGVAVDQVWTVSVASAHGQCVPEPGAYVWTNGDTFAAVVTNGRVQLGDPPAGTQAVYAGWSGTGSASGSGAGSNVSFAVTANSAVVWSWGTNYLLTASAGDHGSVNVTQAWVSAGSSTQVTAVADAYYGFTNWTGDAAGSVNPFDVVMDRAKDITAEFAALVTTSNVPLWWLGQYGITNDVANAVLLDPDADGYATWQEWVCGTVPTNGASRFVFDVDASQGDVVLNWDPAVSGRVYAVEETSELGAGFTNVSVVLSNRVNCWTGETTEGNAFYRVRVENAEAQ